MVSGKNSVIFRFFYRHNCNKSLWKKIFLVSLHLCTSPLVRAPPQLTPFPSPTTCAVENSQRWKFGNSQSLDKFTGKPKTQINIYIYIAHHLTIYEVNGTAISPDIKNIHIQSSINKGFWPATDNDAILAELLQPKEDNFWNWRSKIDCNKYVPNKW